MGWTAARLAAVVCSYLLCSIAADVRIPAPPPPLLETWWHDAAEAQVHLPVGPGNVRTSPHYRVNVTLSPSPKDKVGLPSPKDAAQQWDWERSFVYASIPRSGAPKRGYVSADGAEYAAGAGLSMSWTSFLYGADVWVAVTQSLPPPPQPQPHLPRRHFPGTMQPPRFSVVEEDVAGDRGGHGSDAANVTVRPRRVATGLVTKRIDAFTVAVLIPHRPGGFKISVEFDDVLFDTFNDGTSCCNLTDRPGPGHAFVHRQPRHALLIFAEPMLTPDEAAQLDPEHDPVQ